MIWFRRRRIYSRTVTRLKGGRRRRSIRLDMSHPKTSTLLRLKWQLKGLSTASKEVSKGETILRI